MPRFPEASAKDKETRVTVEIDETLDRATTRTVRLAGRDFYVAPLSLRQILAIADYVPKLSALAPENLSGERLSPLAEVVWHGLRRAHPNLERRILRSADHHCRARRGAAGGDRAGRRQKGRRRRGGNVGGERFDTVDWRALVADLVIELSWTREEVLDQVDSLFSEDLNRAWADYPPLRNGAAYLGHKPPARPSKNYAELLAMFPAGSIR